MECVLFEEQQIDPILKTLKLSNPTRCHQDDNQPNTLHPHHNFVLLSPTLIWPTALFDKFDQTIDFIFASFFLRHLHFYFCHSRVFSWKTQLKSIKSSFFVEFHPPFQKKPTVFQNHPNTFDHPTPKAWFKTSRCVAHGFQSSLPCKGWPSTWPSTFLWTLRWNKSGKLFLIGMMSRGWTRQL